MKQTFTLLVGAVAAVSVHGLVRNQGGKEKASHFLAAEGERLQSPELLSLAQEAQSPDGMDKVKDLIRHMLAQKLTAQAESTDHHSFCQGEMGKSEKKVKRLEQDLEKMQADLDEDTAKLAELKDNIVDTHAELSDAAKSTSEAMNLRQEEHQKFLDDQKALQLEEDKLTRAAAQVEGSEEAIEAAHKAAEAAVEKRVRLEQKEQEAAFEYEKITKKIEAAKVSKNKLVEDHEHEVVRMKHDLVEKESDMRSTREELKASKDYAEQIKHQCTVNPGGSAKERKQRREEEIGSLKEAYGILSGTDIPVMS